MQPDAAAAEPRPTRLEDYTPPDWRVDRLELFFDLDPDRTRVASRLTLARDPSAPPDCPLILDGDSLRLVSVAADGRVLGPADYALDERSLTLPGLPDRCVLEIVTEIAPAANTKLEGLYRSSGTYCTQCEAEGFRRITFFLDRPDVMTTYRVTVRADAATCPVLLSNGNLVEEGRLEDGRHVAVWDDPFPKPSYLFALVAGDLAAVEDRFVTMSGRAVRLRIFVEHGNEPRCTYAMDALKRAMRWDEEAYGREYDLDLFNIVAVSDFNMGAMENKSLNVFNAKYVLADPDTATDTDYAFIETIVAHEYFHNWTGNRITCRDWFQLSLKEGLTVFRDQQFSADMRSPAVKRIRDVRSLRARQFPEDSGPLAHPVRPSSYIEINNFYTATVYEKGAEVIRMQHALLGPEGFRRGMDLYFDRHDGQAVTCDDFVGCMAEANGADLGQFRRWYAQAGTPRVTARGRWDAAAGVYELTLAQATPPTPGQPEKLPLHIPLAVGLLGPDGRDLPLRLDGENAGDLATTRTLDLRTAERTFRFVDLPAAPVPSLNRGFSAPIKLELERDDPALAFLMAHDSDPFNRWEAGQTYATDLLLRMVEAARNGGVPTADAAFVAALGASLADADADPAFAAQMLALPGEDNVAEAMDTVDPDAIHIACRTLRRAVAVGLRERLTQLHGGDGDGAAFAPDAAQAGRRALRNAALGYLAELDDPAMRTLLFDRFRDADNMTDRMAALAAINDLDDPRRADALEAFRRRYERDPVVLDKWFVLEATSALPGTLARVAELTAHPAFSMRNPNKVRALIGAFATANPVRFHAADGAGYAFLADRVIELDRINPLVAARLLPPLGRWKRLDPGRQALMRQALERVLAVPGLSRDVYEIASKSLA